MECTVKQEETRKEDERKRLRKITLTDNGVPQLSSTTKVIVRVADVNDHAPEFDQPYYKVTVPGDNDPDEELFQSLSDASADPTFDLEPWETSQVLSLGNNPIFGKGIPRGGGRVNGRTEDIEIGRKNGCVKDDWVEQTDLLNELRLRTIKEKDK
ncbi:hypothetical protein RUM44_007649 [Polyplax serrata]|uniref:Cadherin domain-containing protein n=1 Tax=Polyplax serrata TaxID=468196 RepID=A0ABR1B708_POLSC